MIDAIIRFSIKNKALVIILTIALVIGGLFSMTKVNLDALPDITNNQVVVITTAPNLSTEDVEKYVTVPVELAMSNLPDVVEIRSISRFGLSVVTIVFEESAGTYIPRQMVSEALVQAKEQIPKEFGTPFMAPISTGLGEIYQYTLEVLPGYDSLYDDMKLRTIQDWIVKRQLSMIPGVVEINSFGGRIKQYEVAVSPERLKSMGLTITDVYNALEKNNENTGGSYIEKNKQAYFIRGEGLMRSLGDIRNTLVKNVNGKPIYVRNVADVRYGSALRYGAFTKDGKGEAVGGIVMMLKGANSNDVIKRVKERIAKIQKSLPEGVVIKPFLDRSKLIKQTTATVAENLTLGALIVIFVLVLFLGNMRGGLIVASTIPLALLFTFVMMYAFDVWANLMSLGALDFGILVDGAVIIIENMLFYLHNKNYIGKKLPRKEADSIAFTSASKMMNSAFFGQLIILIVFIPILALQGVEGKMFKPMAFTFSFAVLGVVILSLTYIPAMAAIFIKPPKTEKENFGNKLVHKIESWYMPILNWALAHKWSVLSMLIILLVWGGFVFGNMGAVFIPKLDEGDIAMQAVFKPGTALSEVIEKTNLIEKTLKEKFPDEIESVSARIGVADIPTDPMPMDVADMFVILKDKEKWKKAETKKELLSQIEEEVKVFTGINFEFSQPIELRFNELLTGVREDIAIKIYGDDMKVLSTKAKEIAGLISGIKGVAGLKIEATEGLPQITVKYDRNKLGLYGLNIRDVNSVIESAFSGKVAGNIYEGDKKFDLVVRLAKEYRKDIENIKNLYVGLPNGKQIPLEQVADINYYPGPMQISRENTRRRTYVGINVGDRDIKSLVEEIQQVLDKKLKLPPGYYIEYGGDFENLENATKMLSVLTPIVLVLIFILVYFAVNSLKHTLMIYLAVPFAAIGGVFSLYLRGMPFSISAGVGFIVLFGVAVLNGLVLVRGLNELRQSSMKSLDEIIKKGSVRRLRPILLTASTDIVGFLPMAISTSAGAEVQRPLATVVIGGMLTSAFLTLIVLPVLYKWIESGKYSSGNKGGLTKTASILPIVLFLFLPVFTNAQNSSSLLTLENAKKIALENYPLIKSSYYEEQRQKALKGTVFDFGNTLIYTGKEEYGNGEVGIDNVIGFGQSDIDLFAIPAKSGYAKNKYEEAKATRILTEKIVEKEVAIAWYEAAIAKKRYNLFKEMDTLFRGFLKAAELRYKSQETSEVEFLAAQAKYKEYILTLKSLENDLESKRIMLNKYLLFDTLPGIEDKNVGLTINITPQDTLESSPLLSLYKTKTDVAKSAYKVQKTELLPKFDIEYKLQNIDGTSGYHGWQVGVTIPLLSFWGSEAKTKAAKLNFEAVSQKFYAKQNEVNAYYNRFYKHYLMLSDIVDFYKNSALPLAEKQISAASLAYKTGNIGYVQFIQSIDNAISVKMKYLDKLAEYYQTIEELKYLSGKN